MNNQLNNQSKLDRGGSTVSVRPDGLVVIDGIPAFRRIVRPDGIVVLQFCDDDRMRSSFRGTRLVEIPVEVLLSVLT